MRVCFVLQDLALSGGVATVLEHARQLAADDHNEVSLALTGPPGGPWDHEALRGLRVVPVADAARDRYDVAIGTWWETCPALFDLPAERRAYLVQSLEHRFYKPPSVEHTLAELTYSLPVAFITEARWIADTLRRRRPDATCHLVRNGIDKSVFRQPTTLEPNTGRPLRILLEGHSSVWFKGLHEAGAAVARMTEPREVTYVANGAGAQTPDGVDKRLGPLSQRELARVYADTDVVVKLSRVEGMFAGPLEGFHMGATCLTTPVTGHDEFLEHGWNGLVVDWGDPDGAARMLDLVARDRQYLHFLRTNALMTAKAWPSWEQSGLFMAAALRRIAEGPAPPAGMLPALGDLQALVRAQAMGPVSSEAQRLAGELAETRALLEAYRGGTAARLSAVVRRRLDNDRGRPVIGAVQAISRTLGGRNGSS